MSNKQIIKFLHPTNMRTIRGAIVKQDGNSLSVKDLASGHVHRITLADVLSHETGSFDRRGRYISMSVPV